VLREEAVGSARAVIILPQWIDFLISLCNRFSPAFRRGVGCINLEVQAGAPEFAEHEPSFQLRHIQSAPKINVLHVGNNCTPL